MGKLERPTIWMNITSSKNWARPPVGIIRVERTISEELEKIYTTSFKKCVWVEDRFVYEFSGKNVDVAFKRGDILISMGLDWDYSYYKQFYFFRFKKGVKIITCCYDLIPVMFPQYCVGAVANTFTSYFLELADASDLILCISKQSQHDLHKLLEGTGAAFVRTEVFNLGDNVPLSVQDDLSKNSISEEITRICQGTFILFVSSIERRKNHEVLYRAYHILCSEGKRETLPKLVFVGMQGWGVSDLLKDIELDPNTKDMIVQLNHVNDVELRKLYEMAIFCVYPSFYEGWGLPIGEALSLGKVVIASGKGSIPEVGGDLVCYVDPWSPRDWANEIWKMVTDNVWRSKLESRVKIGYKARAWGDTAKVLAKSIRHMQLSECVEMSSMNSDVYSVTELNLGKGAQNCEEKK
jgi:glycosyltransferase involved in cell wall biosynthesis